MGRGQGSGGGGLFQEVLKNLDFCLTLHSFTSEPGTPSLCTFPCATSGFYLISNCEQALSLTHTHTPPCSRPPRARSGKQGHLTKGKRQRTMKDRLEAGEADRPDPRHSARKGLLGVGSLWAGKHVGGTKGAAGGGEGRRGLPQDPQGRAQARMMRAVSRGGGGPQGSAGSTCAQDKHRYVSTGVSNSSLTLTSTTRYSWMVGTVAPLSLH